MKTLQFIAPPFTVVTDSKEGCLIFPTKFSLLTENNREFLCLNRKILKNYRRHKAYDITAGRISDLPVTPQDLVSTGFYISKCSYKENKVYHLVIIHPPSPLNTRLWRPKGQTYPSENKVQSKMIILLWSSCSNVTHLNSVLQ